jgi:hypothetical protein
MVLNVTKIANGFLIAYQEPVQRKLKQPPHYPHPGLPGTPRVPTPQPDKVLWKMDWKIAYAPDGKTLHEFVEKALNAFEEMRIHKAESVLTDGTVAVETGEPPEDFIALRERLKELGDTA